MRVLRGRAATTAADRELTQDLITHTADTGESALRVWRPSRMVAFGRRDANRDGYEQARQIATDSGYTAIERTVGGHAVAYTGNTVAFVRTEPVEDSRTGIQDRYADATETLSTALESLGASVETGEPEGAFCPGTHSLSATGKIAGLAQRVRREAAVVSGIVVVCDHEQISDVLAPIYEELGIPFEREAVGSLARAGGQSDPQRVRETLEDRLATGERRVEQVRET